jgi:transcriptional regulator with XRE-family HTH domain
VAPGNDKHPTLLALGRAVKLMREQRGMSLSELAETSGVRRERLDALETGQLDPTYELLVEVAESLGAQPSALVILAEQLDIPTDPRAGA